MSQLVRIFYGWRVVYALCLVTTFTSGLIFYNLSVLLEAFVAERAFPIGLSSVATGVFFIAAGIAGLVAGHLIDRVDARIVMIVSACIGVLALGCIGLLREPWQLFVFYIIFGCSYGGVGLVPTSTIVARWFQARRSKALAVAFTGFSIGGILITPLAALLIKQLGLAGAGPWLAAALFLGIVPATALVVRASPQSGLDTDGASQSAVSGIRFSEAIRSRFFFAVTVAFTCAFAAQLGAIAHLYRLVNVRVDPQAAALAVALVAAASLVGRLVGGWLLAIVSARVFSLGLMIAQTVALAILAYAISKSFILFGAMLFGVGMGNILMLQQLLMAEAFGTRDYGRIYAVSQLIAVVGIACGPPLAGLINQSTGGYTAAYVAVAAVSFAGFVILAMSNPSNPLPDAQDHACGPTEVSRN
jgi:MFS family permease